MTIYTDLDLVVRLACLTEDRTNEEQDALLRVAARVDAHENALTVQNRRRGLASRLYDEAAASRDPEQPPRVVQKTAQRLCEQADRWDART